MGLFGFGRKEGHWIKSTHFFGKDTFECSSCGREFKEHPDRCPRCGAYMRGMLSAWEEQQRKDELEEDYDEYEGTTRKPVRSSMGTEALPIMMPTRCITLQASAET